MQVTNVLETCLYVDDLDAAAQFYSQVLGLHEVSRVNGRHVFYRCGAQMLLIFVAAVSAQGGEVPAHGATGPGHAAFGVTQESLAAWRAHLEKHNVPIEQRYTWGDRGESLYFRDPAGNSLEFTTPRIWGIDEATLIGDAGA